MDNLAHVGLPDLVAELRRRGYRVAKEDRIRTAGASETISVESLARFGEERGWRDHLYGSLGRSLGHFLMRSGAVPVSEELGDNPYTRSFRATATVIVDNPQFDWPYPLDMKP